ncbi:FAD binding domain-containing protein [Demetria terragena]|uniref:FAD binding domain-containing protein n=1 Tax=Demetria terragena TaxID=63959 RepID=UPI00036930A4|nr:xanthine dehydrogenase family protein subunit M [Demetria terragena]
MKPAPFDYVAPMTLDEALNALAAERDVKVLAGGQSLIPVMNLRMGHPEVLVDICRIEQLRRLEIDDEGHLHVGAGVRQAAVLADEQVGARWPLLQAALSHIGHPQIRSRGTVCGSIAHADSAAELPAAAVALDATVVAVSRRGERKIAARDFFVGPFMTTLEEDELVTEVTFPSAARGWAFEEFATRRGDFATAGVAVAMDGAGAAIDSCRVVFFGVAGTPARSQAAEAMLTGGPLNDDNLRAAVAKVATELDPPDDVHAAGAFRIEIAGRLATSAITTAWERCCA